MDLQSPYQHFTRPYLVEEFGKTFESLKHTVKTPSTLELKRRQQFEDLFTNKVIKLQDELEKANYDTEYVHDVTYFFNKFQERIDCLEECYNLGIKDNMLDCIELAQKHLKIYNSVEYKAMEKAIKNFISKYPEDEY